MESLLIFGQIISDYGVYQKTLTNPINHNKSSQGSRSKYMMNLIRDL